MAATTIETYEVAPDLIETVNERGDVIPERIFPVFRDEEELPVDAELASPICRALDASKFLLTTPLTQVFSIRSEISYRFGRGDRLLGVPSNWRLDRTFNHPGRGVLLRRYGNVGCPYLETEGASTIPTRLDHKAAQLDLLLFLR